MRKLKLLLAACALVAGSMTVSAQEAGTYYIQNVGTQKWLGPGNNWGTKASMLNHADYWKLAKISDGVYTLESVVTNGGTNYYLNKGNDGTFCDGGATNFTFTAIDGKENTYSITHAEGGLLTANGAIVDVSASDASAEIAQWKLWSETDMANGMAAATIENPFDATYLIKDHDLGRNNRDYSSWSNTNATEPKTSDDRVSGASRFSIEAFQKTFDVNQTLSGIPNGVYAVRVNGFYRQDGSDENLPYVYAGDSKTTLPARTGTENNMQAAAVSFEAGNYLSDPAYVQVTDNSLKIGVATTGTSCWVIFKNFHLYYYGDCTVAEVVLADYVKAYNEALAEAQAFTEASMFAEAWTNLQTAISDNTLNLSSVTQEQLETATANLKAANAAATAAVKAKTAYDNAVTLINGGTNVDLTSIITNAGFEEGNLNGWTSVDGGAIANNTNFNATKFVERWKNGVALGSGSLTHDAIILPTGLYRITADAQNIEQYNNNAGGKGLFLCANNDQTEIGAKGNYETYVKLADKESLTIKFLLDECTGNWIAYDNVTLTYVGADFPAYTLVTGKMNAEVAAAQTAADEAFQANKTVANYNTLTAAIAAAQASKDAYASAKTAIDNAKDIQNNHNFASATAATTFADAIAALETPYNNNTLTTDAGNGAGTTLGTVVTGWHAAANSAAVAYMNDGFSLNAFDAALYINTWSNEGESDGSNFKVPFYEYFAGDGSALGANKWTGQLSGLENGLYSVSAWVRVRSMNAETEATEATGITMNVNDGTAIDVTEGTQVGESRFQHKVYTAEGLVKDGILKLNFDIASENNIHWLSFKNIKYTKVRDLTPDEMAVAPTAIALYNGETEVTAIDLDATNNTVTLTPRYTPDNATEGVEWTSSNENVAIVVNGVVTGITPGTTTITATSTVDENVKGTATVTVTYPEVAVPTVFFVNEGATRKIITPNGDNLIKNGSFEYANPYYGWTYGTGSTTAITSEKFDIITEEAPDGNQYLKAKTNEGGAAAGSLNTSWPIEPNKTYVFGYKVKAKDASTGNQYIGTSLNTKKGQENADAKLTNPAYSANEWVDVNYVFESGDNTWLVFNARWLASNISFDNFYLAEATYTIEGNVDYATAAIPTANIGTGAFQYSQDAIDAANALVQGTATVDEVEAAYTALTTINEPTDGQLFNVSLANGSWSYTKNNVTYYLDNEAMTYMAGDRSDHGGYNIKYQAVANTNLAQAFTFTKVEGNNYKMSQIDADGENRYVCTVTGGGYGNDNRKGIRTTTDASKALAVTVIPTATEGVWNLKNTEANDYIGSQDAGVYTVNSHIDFNIVETAKPSIAINTTAAGWGTVMLPFAVASLPTGVKAYTCAEVDGPTLTLAEVSAIEANKPYIIEGAWNETLTGDAQGTALNYTEGLLTGVYAEINAPVNSYVLQKQGDVVGFYKVAEGENMQPKVPANRAYLTTSSTARALYFDNATAIKAIEALTSGEAEIYNAAGARQNKLQKGVNIIKQGNKTYKVMVK